jgi:hypothetical protein
LSGPSAFVLSSHAIVFPFNHIFRNPRFAESQFSWLADARGGACRIREQPNQRRDSFETRDAAEMREKDARKQTND